jgi:hypothetical protein
MDITFACESCGQGIVIDGATPGHDGQAAGKLAEDQAKEIHTTLGNRPVDSPCAAVRVKDFGVGAAGGERL